MRGKNFVNVSVRGLSGNSLRTNWVIPGNVYGGHVIYVVIENSLPEENDLTNSEASRSVFTLYKMETADVAVPDSDIAFPDNEPSEGERTNVFVTVHNVGVIDVENVGVALYADNIPVSLTTVPLIKQGSENLASIDWVPSAGDHEVKIRLLLEGVGESNYNNNTASTYVNFREGCGPHHIMDFVDNSDGSGSNSSHHLGQKEVNA